MKLIQVRKYPCKNCGHLFDACPPDDLYVVAMRKKCIVYSTGMAKCVMPQNYECENCDQTTVLFWHRKTGHINLEIMRAKEKAKSQVLDDVSQSLKND